MVRKTCLLIVVVGLVAATVRGGEAGPARPFDITLAFLTKETAWSDKPPVLTVGEPLIVEAKWPSSYKSDDQVYYNAWIEGQACDWASANTPKMTDSQGRSGWRQYAALSRVREGASKSVRMKMYFDYRRAGMSSHRDSGGGDAAALAPALPLQPRTYRFSFNVERVVAGAAPVLASREFEMQVAGDPAQPVVSGIADYQVFQRASKTAGPIAFEIVVPTGDAEASIAIKGPDQKVRESRITAGPCGKAAVIDDVPVGGPYTVEVSASGLTQSFKNIFVGDLWIISGQSNAVGCGSNAELGRKAMAGVHVLSPKYGQLKWQPASDGMFEQTVGAWVTAAQEFYKETHVPVGMLGHAVGSKPMDYFLDPQTGEVTVLHDLVERHARNAAVFFWYQGESDTFNPDNSRAYGQKLDALARIMRRYTGNAEMMIGTVQLARYMWQHDDSFAEVREAQRQFVLRDAHAVLYSTLPYPINDKDKIHLTTEGYVELGQQIARQMIQREKTGKLNSPGPMLRSVAFAGGDRRRVVVSFDNAAKLTGGDSPDEWYVMDQAHRGFKDGGFVPLAKVTVDAAHAQVLLDLTQSAAGPSVVCYGFRADIGGTLRNDEGNPAVCFAKVAVGEP